MTKTPAKLLCLCDSPTLETGFARVAQNLISRWNDAGIFEQIWCWGIGYNGFPHRFVPLANRIFPAATSSQPQWYHPDNLKRFLLALQEPNIGDTPGGFTHVWIMQDLFALDRMSVAFEEVMAKKGIYSLLYFPVDAPLEPSWSRFIAAVDVPVAYCPYGAQEARAALSAPMGDKAKDANRSMAKSRLRQIPHGVDTEVYRPVDASEARKKMFSGALTSDRFLMANIAQHQPRKGLAQSLWVLRRLKDMRPELKPALYFHCNSYNTAEGTDLSIMGRQIGLIPGEDFFFGDGMFQRGHALLGQEELNQIYNMADLVLTTSYGEGWGLPLTEAMAVGTPVAGPRHTSIADLLDQDRGILFDTLGWDVVSRDNSRFRPRSDVDDAARRISEAQSQGMLEYRAGLAQRWVRETLSWDRVATQWLDLFSK